ncbi:MAG: DUF1963 domain-containing protein [Planctomycetota bacterium]|nr:DUF1963 domain-containing protein [Planctomycetota bacterium]
MADGNSPFRQCLQAISRGDGETLRRVVRDSPELHGEGLEHLVDEAAKTGSIELLETLEGLNLGAEVYYDWGMVNAADGGHLELVRWFLDRGVPVNRVSRGLRESASLHSAIQNQHLELVKLLIGQGAVAAESVRQQAEGEVEAFLRSFEWKSDLQLRRELGLLGGVSAARLPGESEYLSAVVADQNDDSLKLKYADWLEGQGENARGDFLRKLVRAKQSMQRRDLPDGGALPDDWRDMVGHGLIQSMIRHSYPEPQQSILKLARPALDIVQLSATDDDLPIGSNKLGGLPDLPADVPWPTFGDCTDSYSGMSDLSPEESQQLCGFVGQFHCADLVKTLAGKPFPAQGLLSLFFVIDPNSGQDGVRLMYHPDVSALRRKSPPGELVEPNEIKPVQAVALFETLALPSKYGPWGDDLNLSEEQQNYDSDQNYANLEFSGDLLGYFCPTTGSDVTPDKETQQLGKFQVTDSLQIHLQISNADLAARNFDGVRVAWIDYN